MLSNKYIRTAAVLETNPGLRMDLQAALKELNVRILQTGAQGAFGYQGIAVAKERCDLIIVDATLEDMSAAEFLARLRQNQRFHLSHIIVTGFDEAAWEATLPHGVSGFLKKPFDRRRFVKFIEQMLEDYESLERDSETIFQRTAGRYYEAKGEYKRALECYEQTLTKVQKAESFFDLGRMSSLCDDREQAITYFNEAVKADPTFREKIEEFVRRNPSLSGLEMEVGDLDQQAMYCFGVPMDRSSGSYFGYGGVRNALAASSSFEVRTHIKAILPSIGISSIEPVESGREVMAALAGRPIDLLVIDLALADLDGVRLTELIRQDEAYRRTKILALVDWKRFDSLEAAFEVGADGYVIMPLSMELMRGALNTMNIMAALTIKSKDARPCALAANAFYELADYERSIQLSTMGLDRHPEDGFSALIRAMATHQLHGIGQAQALYDAIPPHTKALKSLARRMKRQIETQRGGSAPVNAAPPAIEVPPPPPPKEPKPTMAPKPAIRKRPADEGEQANWKVEKRPAPVTPDFFVEQVVGAGAHKDGDRLVFSEKPIVTQWIPSEILSAMPFDLERVIERFLNGEDSEESTSYRQSLESLVSQARLLNSRLVAQGDEDIEEGTETDYLKAVAQVLADSSLRSILEIDDSQFSKKLTKRLDTFERSPGNFNNLYLLGKSFVAEGYLESFLDGVLGEARNQPAAVIGDSKQEATRKLMGGIDQLRPPLLALHAEYWKNKQQFEKILSEVFVIDSDDSQELDVDNLIEAMELDRNSVEAFKRIYTTLGNRKFFDEQEDFYEAKSDTLVNNEHARFVLNDFLTQLGKADHAVDFLEKSHVLDKKEIRIVKNLAVMAMKLGKHPDTIKYCKKMLKIDGSSADAFNLAGITYKKLNDLKKAVAYYKKGISFNPESSKLYYNLAIALAGLGEEEASSEAHAKASELDPENVKSPPKSKKKAG